MYKSNNYHYYFYYLLFVHILVDDYDDDADDDYSSCNSPEPSVSSRYFTTTNEGQYTNPSLPQPPRSCLPLLPPPPPLLFLSIIYHDDDDDDYPMGFHQNLTVLPIYCVCPSPPPPNFGMSSLLHDCVCLSMSA